MTSKNEDDSKHTNNKLAAITLILSFLLTLKLPTEMQPHIQKLALISLPLHFLLTNTHRCFPCQYTAD